MRLLLLLFSLVVSCSSQAAVKVNIATDPWCPYICEYGDPQPGLLIEIAEQAFAESDYATEFIWLSWARAINEVRRGNTSAVIGAYKTDAPDFVFGEEHLALSQMCFYIRQDDKWSYNGVLDLDSRVLSIVNSYSYGQIFDNYILNNENVGAENITRTYGKETIATRVQLVAQNRVDTMVEDALVMKHINKTLKPSEQLKQAGCLPAEKLFVAFSPNSNLSPRLSRALDQGIKQLKQSGKLDKILAQYQ